MSYEPSDSLPLESPPLESPIEAARVEEKAVVEAVVVAPVKQPQALPVLCIALLLLGIAGGFMGVWSFVAALAGPALQEMMTLQQPGMPNEMKEQQQQMQAAMGEVTLRYRTVNLGLALAHMLIAAGLVFGAIGGLKKSRRAVGLLSMLCLAAIVFELAKAAPSVMMQREMSLVMAETIPSMIVAGQGAKASQNLVEVAKVMTLGMQVAMLMSIVVAIAWVAAKVILYGFVVSYLRRPAVKASLH